ncbi:branched-chain amino acid transport system ATP-binding protein [Azospirillaceae bacterium]
MIVLLPNLLSNRSLFQLFSIGGFLAALFAGFQQFSKNSGRLPFQALAPIVAMGILALGGFFVTNTEDWRKAIFALMLFSVVVGLPEGLMGVVSPFLVKLFRIDPPAFPPFSSIDEVLPVKPVTGKPLLVLQDIKRYFGGVKAVDGVSITVRSGHIHGLIGPNGSGKSTVVNVISGLYAPGGGKIFFHQKPLPKGSLYRAAQCGVARTFQNLQLFSALTALENVMTALRDVYRAPWPLVVLGLAVGEERRAHANALALLSLVGLQDQARRPAKDLTYGAQRFLEIARALARKPDLLILDEPAAGLASPDVARLIEIIQTIHQRGVTIILIEHHMDVVAALCDVVTVLDGGRVIAEGAVAEVKRNPKVIDAYLGAELVLETSPN